MVFSRVGQGRDCLGGGAWAELVDRSNGDFDAEDGKGTEKSDIPGRLIVWAADGLEQSPGRALPQNGMNS